MTFACQSLSKFFTRSHLFGSFRPRTFHERILGFMDRQDSPYP
ncbi:hypothetical protein I3842_09G140900 [Carya illinoinensis]|uniref:Uncharacterized protein n=1 Tax=Carya illinoinensis TaxID=32201 RepID=A0A922E699_CARIL|nr:hypothetical protein I3842_09G140900 [Carya illinoinensis]